MTRVTLICKTCGHKARRDLAQEVACRGTHETPSELSLCPKGHGEMVRHDTKRLRSTARLSVRNGKMTITARGAAASVVMKLLMNQRRKDPT